MNIKCECGGMLKRAVIDTYDFSPEAGVPVTLHNVPGLRCQKCGGETLVGHTINTALTLLALKMITMEVILDGNSARYLRKFLGVTQADLAGLMGIARGTVADWERGADGMSPEHDYILRGLVYNAFTHAQGDDVKRKTAADLYEAACRSTGMKMEVLPLGAVRRQRSTTPPAFVINELLKIERQMRKHGKRHAA